MAHGAAQLAFAHADGLTRQGRTYAHDPLRLLLPRAPTDDVPIAVVVTTSGGLVGGDRLDMRFAAERDSAALITSQAAEKVYRSTGADCRCNIDLRVDAGGWLEWMPQETIVFDGARLRRRTTADVAPGGRLLAGEILVLGRTAMGERLTHGLVREAWEVSTGGRLTWSDALHLDGDIGRVVAARAGFDGAHAVATLVYVGEDARGRLALARGLLETAAVGSLKSGFTLIGEVLIGRWLSRDAAVLRRAYAAFWGAFRHRVAGLPARPPAVWQVES